MAKVREAKDVKGRNLLVDDKYDAPYPQEFHRFYPKHAFKAGISVVITFVLIVVLSIAYRVPTNHDMPPLPDHGVSVPGPEWYLLAVFEPFWQFGAEDAALRQIGTFWLPLGVLLFLLAVPFLFGRKRWSEQPRVAKRTRLIRAGGTAALWLILILAVVGRGYDAKTTSCISCHTPMAGARIALPPADMAKHYREVREMEIALGRNRPGEESEAYKDANWHLRHFQEPTENW